MTPEQQVAALEWFTVADKIGFRGVLGGYRRQILGQDRKTLEALAHRMARGVA